MKAPYQQLGMATAWRRFSLEAADHAPSTYERQLRDVEAGTAALNMSVGAVHLAAEVAAFQPELDDEHRIALILLIVVSLAALEEGSTRFPVTGAGSVEPMRRLLGAVCGSAFGTNGVARMSSVIERLLNSRLAPAVVGTNPGECKPLVHLSPFIYQHRVLADEIALTRRLAGLMKAQPAPIDATLIDAMLRQPITHAMTARAGRTDLSEEQRAAVESAVTEPFTIISGGPGTGKTSIVRAILKVLAGAGLNPAQIAMAAPTGKAAYRIGESIRESASDEAADGVSLKDCPAPTTVHRLLGYSPTRRRFRHHKDNPLGAQVVIVDEGSMLDLELMSRLLDALRPGARLVLLGDANQLPSVSAGAVFRDLLPLSEDERSGRSRHCVRLTRSFRMNSEEAGGRAIGDLAAAINAGDTEVFNRSPADSAPPVARREDPAQIEFAGAEWLDAPAPNAEFLERWYAQQLRGDGEAAALENRVFSALADGFASADCESLRRVFEHLAKARILCVTRVLDSGSERLNSLLHRRVAHGSGVFAAPENFLVGEPVMVLRNDYERMLFNGDQGVVLRVRRPDLEATLMAVFPRRDNFVAFPIDALRDHLELCYAMTVHKAQGSEFDAVAVVMPNQDIPILSREILYTAVSRARRSAIIVGSGDVIKAAIARRIERYSGVREQLALRLAESQRE